MGMGFPTGRESHSQPLGAGFPAVGNDSPSAGISDDRQEGLSRLPSLRTAGAPAIP